MEEQFEGASYQSDELEEGFDLFAEEDEVWSVVLADGADHECQLDEDVLVVVERIVLLGLVCSPFLFALLSLAVYHFGAYFEEEGEVANF